MWTSSLAGWHCTLPTAASRPLLSVTCAINMFGNPVAYSSCVARRAESFRGDRKQGKPRSPCRRAAERNMGWTQLDSGGDVSIVAIEMTRNQHTLNTFYDGFGGGWGWRRLGGGGFAEATTIHREFYGGQESLLHQRKGIHT
jgi:hypothetical protein